MIPDDEDSAPEIGSWDGFWFDAFWKLSTCRGIGPGGAGPIPWTAVVAYARQQQLDGPLTEFLVEAISAMDGVWLEDQREQAEAQARAAKRGRRK